MQPIFPRWMLWTLCGFMLVFVFLVRIDRATGHEWWRMEECRFQSLQRGTWTPHEEQLTASCAVRHFPVSGGLPKLESVISCESGWNRLAESPTGSYVGLAQHSASAYVYRIHAYQPAAWDVPLSTNWRNARGQLVMTARMAQGGWGPWSCA